MTKILILVGLIVFVSLVVWSRRAAGPMREEAHRLVAEGAALVDVRSPSEFAAGHVEGAVNIPVGDLAGRATEIGPKTRPVVVYCRSGARSAAAKQTLEAKGWEKVLDLGAMGNW